MRKPYVPPPALYNSAAETGFRTLRILEALHPARCSRRALALLDHAVVHTADFGGPKSLHVDLPGRVREIEVRRGYIDAGLVLLRRLDLIEAEGEGAEATYLAGEDVPSFLSPLDAPYTKGLGECAEWLVARFDGASEAGIDELRRMIEERDAPDEEDWSAEDTGSHLRRFADLQRIYASDALRMDSLEEVAFMMSVYARWAVERDAEAAAAAGMPELKAELERVQAGAGAEVTKVGRDRRDLTGLMREMEAEAG